MHPARLAKKLARIAPCLGVGMHPRCSGFESDRLTIRLDYAQRRMLLFHCDAPRPPNPAVIWFGLLLLCIIPGFLAIVPSPDQPMVAFDSPDYHPVTALLKGSPSISTTLGSASGRLSGGATPLCHAAPPGGDRGPLPSRCCTSPAASESAVLQQSPWHDSQQLSARSPFPGCVWVGSHSFSAGSIHRSSACQSARRLSASQPPPPPDGALRRCRPVLSVASLATFPWPQIPRQQMTSSTLQFQSSTLSRVARRPGWQRCRRQRRRVTAAAAAAAAAVWPSSLCTAPAAGRMPPLCAAGVSTRSPCGSGLAARKSCVTTAGEGGHEGLMHALA